MANKDFIKKLIGKKGVKLYHKIQGKRIDRKEEKYYQARKKMYGELVKPGELAFDVGANEGNRVKPLLAVGARVVAVEPQESCYKKLQETYGDKIVIVPMGLDEKEGERDMYIASISVFSSFSTEWIDSVKEGRFYERTWGEKVQVPMTTLDRLIKGNGVPTFIKVDVEGFELQVLKGLSTPVKHISFEYTVPEQVDDAIKCIRQIESLDRETKFNYSREESMKWAMSKWLTADEMVDYIQTKEFQECGNGDIYSYSPLADKKDN
ncbi:MAG: FkbM family methyltransferase [Dysgonomonas sp.]|nr:FkbM family methyltransferase [Dysgonomonas sp.]